MGGVGGGVVRVSEDVVWGVGVGGGGVKLGRGEGRGGVGRWWGVSRWVGR